MNCQSAAIECVIKKKQVMKMNGNILGHYQELTKHLIMKFNLHKNTFKKSSNSVRLF